MLPDERVQRLAVRSITNGLVLLFFSVKIVTNYYLLRVADMQNRAKHLPADERRAVTVQAVVDLAAQQNPSEITTAAIARHMNVTQGSLFRHFPNKDAIWRAVMQWVAERLLARIERSVQDIESPVAAMQAMFMSHIDFVAEHPGVPRMLFGELQRAETTPAKRMVQILIQRYGLRIAFAGGFGWDWRHMIFPVIVLSARPVAYITRVTFVTLGAIFFEDYIRTANAKGLSRRQVVNGHALRNAAVPILTAGAISLRFALGALPVVEFFFGWPGLGDRMLTGIRNGEVEVVATLALALGTTFLVVNLVLDVLYRYIDPRIRETVA